MVGLILSAFILWVVAYLVARWLHSRGWPDWQRDVLAAGILALACAGYFWRILFGGATMPADGGDLVSFLYPTYRFAADSLAAGQWPLWNPHLYSGAPHVADIQAGFLYPVNLLLFTLVPGFDAQAMSLLSIVHVWWAGLGMYVFVRSLRWGEARASRAGRPAALAAGIAFAFCDPFFVHFGNLNYIAVASWLPWVMACFVRALEARPRVARAQRAPFSGLGWAATGGLLLGIATLAGHIQATLFIGLAAVLYGGFWLWFEAREAEHTDRRYQVTAAAIRLLADLAVLAGVGFLIAAPVLLPALELTQYTSRAGWSYQETVGYSLSPAQWIGFLVPGFFGRGPQLHWGLWPRVEVGYLGILPLVLALLAVLARRDRVAWTLAGMAAASFVLALGIYSIPHGWLSLLPGFSLLRAPARLVLVVDFGLAALAGLGLQVLAGPIGEGETWKALTKVNDGLGWASKAVLAVVVPLTFVVLLVTQDSDPVVYVRIGVAAIAIMLFVGFLLASWGLIAARRSGSAQPATVAMLGIVLIFLDLASTGAYNDLSEQDPTAGFQHPAIIDFLRDQETPFRIDVRTDIEQLWQPDTALLAGLDDVWGLVNPSTLGYYERYWEGLGSRSARLYDFLNAVFVIGRKDVELDWSKYELAFDGDPDLNVYHNREALPRAMILHQAQAVAGPDAEQEAWLAVQAPGFDPASTVVLEGESGQLPAVAPAVGTEEVRWVERGNHEIALEVTMSAPGYLVLSEVWYPGWRAETEKDGQVESQPVLRANSAFRAVPLEQPGTYTVRLWFEPASWRLGWVLAMAGLVLLGVLAAWSWWRGSDQDVTR